MQVGFMPAKETIDVVFILRHLQEEYGANSKKLFVFFVDLDNVFVRAQRKA